MVTQFSRRHLLIGICYVLALAVISWWSSSAADVFFEIAFTTCIAIHLAIVIVTSRDQLPIRSLVLVFMFALIVFWIIEHMYLESGYIRRYTPYRLF